MSNTPDATFARLAERYIDSGIDDCDGTDDCVGIDYDHLTTVVVAGLASEAGIEAVAESLHAPVVVGLLYPPWVDVRASMLPEVAAELGRRLAAHGSALARHFGVVAVSDAGTAEYALLGVELASTATGADIVRALMPFPTADELGRLANILRDSPSVMNVGWARYNPGLVARYLRTLPRGAVAVSAAVAGGAMTFARKVRNT